MVLCRNWFTPPLEVGSAGQTAVKAFDNAEQARREMDKLVAEKLRKGYVEE
ncbi:WGR domain-containing protein [Cupriavidus sp. NPDC089707]|uniref:WGR domain-containing protein n=1 Tax=Cupriavidus sp. NPDC089707 TaxID=3363963 RepID=UPI0037F517F7